MRVQSQTTEAMADCAVARGSKLTRSAQEFEAQMMKELLEPICHRDNAGAEGSGYASALTGFAAEALGQSMSKAGGFGIAERILKEVSRNETQCSTRSETENITTIELRILK